MLDHAIAEEYAQKLEQHPDFRIIRRYQRPERYCPAEALSPETPLYQGLIVDLETTGLSYGQDRIIECALLPFEYTAQGQIVRILPAYSGFEDPQKEIPLHVQALTGITPSMVAHQRLESDTIIDLVNNSTLLIAHNASFDRKFFEARFPELQGRAWACSATQVPWREWNIEGIKLSFIAYRLGFFYEGHRALNDCEATLHALALAKEAFPTLLQAAEQPSLRLFALNAPFAKKDLLRARGYYWNDGQNGQPKAWFIDLLLDKAEAERSYLRTEIIGQEQAWIPEQEITAYNRFSASGL